MMCKAAILGTRIDACMEKTPKLGRLRAVSYQKIDALSCRSIFSGMEILQGSPRSRSNVSAKIDMIEASYLRRNGANMNFTRLSYCTECAKAER
jgi:hypothetical protein